MRRLRIKGNLIDVKGTKFIRVDSRRHKHLRLVSYHLSMSFELEDPFFFLHDEETKVKLTAGVSKDPF